MDATVTLAQIGDDCLPVDDTPGMRVEVGQGWPMIVMDESLTFHLDRAADLGGRIDIASDGFLARLQTELDGMLPDGFAAKVSWSPCDGPDDVPFVQIEAWLPEDQFNAAMTVQQAYDLLWPGIATLINITDPGTFNSPYLYAGVTDDDVDDVAA